jgi:hypothetical protein
MVVGTPGYLAPEVLEGGDAGPEADVFSWAATLAFVASGRPPYGTGPVPAVAYRVVHGEPDLSEVPPWLVSLLRECMMADPEDRPTAARLAERLTALEGEEAVVRADELRADEIRADGLRADARPDARGPRPARSGAKALATGASGQDGLLTREWAPGRVRKSRSADEIRARHRDRVHRRWVIGSGFVVGLLAASTREYLPEVSLLLLVVYGVGVLIDAGLGLLGKSRSRMLVDVAGGAGVVALWAVLSSVFSTFTLLLAVGAVLFLLVMIAAS